MLMDYLNLTLPGALNQVYTNKEKKEYLNYKDIFEFIFSPLIEKNIDKKKFEEIQLFTYEYFNSLKTTINLEEIFDQYFNKINSQFKCDLISQYNECNVDKEFYYLERNIVDNIIDQGFKIVLVHENMFDCFVEFLFLKKISYNDMFTFILKDTVIDLIKIMPKNYLCFDYDINRLKMYSDLGTWTVFLTHYTFTTFNFINVMNPLRALIVKNIKLIKENGKFFNFSVEIFYQITYYFKIIIDTNNTIIGSNSDSTKLEKEINKFSPIKVLVFCKMFFIKAGMKKAHHHSSNNEVLFIYHCGGLSDDLLDEVEDLDLKINGHFDLILFKFSEVQELLNYTNFYKITNKYLEENPNCLSLSSLTSMSKVLKRDSMLEMLNSFCTRQSVHDLNIEFQTKMVIPHSYCTKLTDVYELKQFKEFLVEKNLKLPLIIKYSGPTTKFNHMMINIITEEGLINYIEYMKNIAKDIEDKVTMLVQTFVNHGGYVLKLYRINKESFVYLRPSLPDVSEELVKKYDEYKDGFMKIETTQLLSSEYIKFWEKLSNDSNLNKHINREYLDRISLDFEKFSGLTLLGLDFLYDLEKNEYSLVDANCYPGYKEMTDSLNGILISHVVKYNNKQ